MREKSNDRDELSFIGFAFPVSFGVLLISFILNSCAEAQMDAKVMHMLELFGHTVNVIGAIMVFGSMLISFVIIIRYALREKDELKIPIKQYIKKPIAGIKNINAKANADEYIEYETMMNDNQNKDTFEA